MVKYANPPNQSKGILDDFAVRKNVATREGTVEKTPVNDSDIVNKKYVDDQFPVTHASTTGQTTDDHHAESHDIASHSDTTATGTELNTLTDNSIANTLHRHSELVASDGSPDPALSVDATGNVGIGINPTSKLNVYNAGTDKSLEVTTTGDNTNQITAKFRNEGRGANANNVNLAIGFSSLGSNWFYRNLAAADTAGPLIFIEQDNAGDDQPVLKIQNDGTGYALITDNGNVGIGTTAPYSLASIGSLSNYTITDGTDAVSTLGLNVFITETGKYAAAIKNNNSNGNGLLILSSDAAGEYPLRIQNRSGTAELFNVNGNGNVGIGTSTPNDELEVAGAIRVSTDSAYVADEARIYYDSALGLVLTGKAGTTNDFTVAGNNGHLMITQPQGTNHLCLVPTGGKVGIGTATPDTKLQVVGAIASSTLTVTASADNTDVSGVNTMFITTSGGSVIIGGFKGGVAGQVLYIARKDATNDLTLEHAEGVGTQDIIMHEGTDETIDNYGGFVLVCDGSDWYDCSHAKHV